MSKQVEEKHTMSEYNIGEGKILWNSPNIAPERSEEGDLFLLSIKSPTSPKVVVERGSCGSSGLWLFGFYSLEEITAWARLPEPFTYVSKTIKRD